MAWKSQGGGPWGGGGGSGGGGGPWGGGGGSGGGGGGVRPPGGNPPDIEELLKKSQDRVKNILPGGVGGVRGILLLLLVGAALWLASGFYRIQPGEQGVELLFGEFVKRTEPGLKYWPPAPIGEVVKVNVENTNSINVGFRGNSGTGRAVQDVPQESLMITGDQNIVDIDFVVQWRIKDAAAYLFNVRNPEATIKIASESAIREVVGRTPLGLAITTARDDVDQATKDLLQEILDSYDSGITIAQVKQQNADPPQPVIDAFNDVQRAKQDQERVINEANRHQNDIVPRARGEAQKILQDAEAYRERVIAEANGEAQRFIEVYEAYKTNREVTLRRLYLERMQDVLQRSDKVIIDEGTGGGSGVVPYLPLNELRKTAN